MKKENWRIDFTWIKACAGHSGNELADKLTKEAIKNSEICYNKIPKSETERQESEKKPQQNGNSNGKPPPKDW